MSLIDTKFDYWCQNAVDIREHLPILKRYASECNSIVEMGVRAIVSTWALLAGRPKSMTSIDICNPIEFGSNINDVYDICKYEGINFNFIQASTLEISIEPAELLFIDTIHTYDQLSKELALHGGKALKYLIFHDTECCPDLNDAIHEYILNHPWSIKEVYKNNNGLTILERKKL
jgi:hypothetical protein